MAGGNSFLLILAACLSLVIKGVYGFFGFCYVGLVFLRQLWFVLVVW